MDLMKRIVTQSVLRNLMKNLPPPELKREIMEANPIFTQIDILNIDFIDTVSMSAGLTVDIHMTWRDHKLVFENILDGKGKVDSFKVIAKREFEDIWLPMPEIIHENALLGKVIEDKVFYVKVIGKSMPLEMNLKRTLKLCSIKGHQMIW